MLDAGTACPALNIVNRPLSVMMMRLKATPKNFNIIQAYAPTAGKPESENTCFYAEINQLLSHTRSETILILGDFNAKVVKGRCDDTVGVHGLGIRNEKDNTLVQCCQEEKMFISITSFNTHTYMEISPKHTRPSN